MTYHSRPTRPATMTLLKPVSAGSVVTAPHVSKKRGRIPHFWEVIMATTTLPLLQQRIHEALFEQRCARHHLDCDCRVVDHRWCTRDEKVRQQSLDRLLDRITP